MTVLCLVEHDDDGAFDASLRALTFARTLAGHAADDVVAVGVGEASDALAADLSSYGAAEAYLVAAPRLAAYAPVAWARALAQLLDKTSASAVVAAGSERGNEVMAHLGALTGLTMVANCVAAAPAGGGSLRLSRYRWAGSLTEDAVLEASPALLTVAIDGVAAEPVPAPASTELHGFEPSLGDKDLEVAVTESRGRSGGVSLGEARVVVGGGRGIGGPEGFAAIEELAGLLGGTVGVSRAVTSLGWRSHKEQVGQTGTKISPDLYLVCGISGAIQHLAGCQNAKHVIAVNTDADAPIMSRADYGVVGDVNLVLPALIAALQARCG